jgi:hypothetical protein
MHIQIRYTYLHIHVYTIDIKKKKKEAALRAGRGTKVVERLAQGPELNLLYHQKKKMSGTGGS